MRKLVLFFALILISTSVVARDPWDMHSATKYSTGILNCWAAEYDFSFANSGLGIVNGNTASEFRATNFWIYNGTNQNLYIARWRYDNNYDDEDDPSLTTRIYLETYYHENPWNGICIKPGEYWSSTTPCDGFYYEKGNALAVGNVLWEASR